MNNWEPHDSLEPIAIIGIACRFPGAKTVDEFWQNLRNGVESISFLTDEELLAAGVDPALLTQSHQYVKAKPVLADVEMFDAQFFGFTPREAELMDPQHRLLLECAWESLESAGYNSETYPGQIGVYAGLGLGTYLLRNLVPNLDRLAVDNLQLLMSNDKDFGPTRVSYKLNLKGPSVSVGTACSTSLVAVQMACQSLLNYQCDMALAGGVAVSVPQEEGYVYHVGGIASPDGHCRAFDANAQGTVFGSGLGILVLKRLEEALADGDFIHAVIKGAAINNDGALKVGYTAPSIEGQAAVIAEAQAVAGVAAETITYVEAHGTGTALGDPIEIAALTQAFRASTNKKGFCAIGSVKTNFGHLDIASGVAGLIKTVLALQHKSLPPSLHFQTPNPQIDFASSPFYVNAELAEWTVEATPRRAGVSSFGIGGTNAHVILEEAPERQLLPFSRPWQLLPLSAKTSAALDQLTANLTTHLQQQPQINLADVAYTLQVGRRGFNHRRLLVCQGVEDAISSLQTQSLHRVLTHIQELREPSIVFLFPGQGSQYVNMGLELYQTEPTFRNQIDRCSAILKPHLGFDLLSVLYPSVACMEAATQQLQQTAIAQPALFAIEYALAQLWMSWGVRPHAMIGHSVSEYVAACMAGVFSLEDALWLVAKRGQLMQQLPPGAMLAIPLPESEIQPLLNNNLSLAAMNAACQCVVSGPIEVIDTLQQQLASQGLECRRLHTSHAFHSQMMDLIVQPFVEQVKKIQLHSPQIAYLSSVSGTWITAAQATDPQYWARHLRAPVQFAAGVEQVLQGGQQILLEVGPGRTLSTLVLQHPQKTADQSVLTSLRHPHARDSDLALLYTTLGKLWLSGVAIDWSEFHAHEPRQRLPLPTYPFERQRYWIDPPSPSPIRQRIQPILPSTQLWQTLTTAATKQATTGLLDIDQSAYSENKQWLDRLCIAYMNLTLRQLGAFDQAESCSFETLFETCQIIPRYRQLFQRWLEVLVEAGQLQQHEQGFSHLVPCSQDGLNELIAEVKARWARTPQIVGLIQHCGENLVGVLTGVKEPLELFTTLVDDPTQSQPDFFLYAYYKAILRESLEQVVQSLPASVRLRIVEIGGGTGLATRELLPVLPDQRTEYCFTDVGRLFLHQAQQKFKDYPFMQYRLLDIDHSPLEQGFTNHSFDVAIAFNVLHVARNLDTTLEYTRTLLAPDGILLLWEITQPTVDFDMTFGLLMNPLEDGDRSQSNPFLSPEQWQAALQRHGFAEVAAVPTPNEFGQHIVLAQADVIAASPANAAFTALMESVTASSVSESSKRELTDWFYLPSWTRSGLSQMRQSLNQAIAPQCWLVFVDQSGFGDQLIERLERAGQTVIGVRIGEEFSRQSEFSTYRLAQRRYTINPQHPDDYNRLLADLKNQPQLLTQIVHLWSVTPSSDDQSREQNWNNAQTLGFNSVLFLAQAIGTQNFTDGIELAIISTQMQSVTGEEVLCPEKALVLGAVKVIPIEYSNINCRSVDILLPAANHDTSHLVEVLLQELLTQSSESVIAYRGCHRWVQTFEPVRLDETFQGSDRLKQGGVYLITGGLGNIGLTVAHYLAETVQAKLILVGRSAFPERQDWDQWLADHPVADRISSQIRSLQAIEQMGSAVWVAQADVAQLEQMRSVVAGAQERFGQIHGVVHAAGVLGDSAIQSKTLEEINRVLESKVRGTQVLDVLFREMTLNFLVLFSSLSSIAPVFGQVAYCAASNFLDTFTHSRSTQHQTFTTCINWSLWQGEGMAYDAGKSSVLQQLKVEHFKQRGILPNEGIEVFSRILGSSLPQVLVSTWDDLSVAKAGNTCSKDALEMIATGLIAKHARPTLKSDYVAPRTDLEQTLADIWQALLGIESIGVDDDFFELGGDSLFATQATSRIRESLQVNLSVQSLFDYPTICSLSECLVQQEPEPGKVAAIARARQKLKQMSPEDIQRLLQTKAGSKR